MGNHVYYYFEGGETHNCFKNVGRKKQREYRKCLSDLLFYDKWWKIKIQLINHREIPKTKIHKSDTHENDYQCTSTYLFPQLFPV